MNKNDLRKAIRILMADKDAPLNVIQKLQEIVDNKGDKDGEVDLIDRNHCFASVLWREEEIRDWLMSNGYFVSDESVTAVIDNLDIDKMEDYGSGWQCVYEAVEKAEKYGLIIRRK